MQLKVQAKIAQEVELDFSAAREVTVEFLCRMVSLQKQNSWTEYDIHKGEIGTWENCYHDYVEFIALIKNPTEPQVTVANMINAINKYKEK